MTQIVNPDEIERIVGANRHQTLHLGRAISAEQTVYILHSQVCKDTTPDLRECSYSVALDAGIDEYDWSDLEDQTVVLGIAGEGWDARLVPDRQRNSWDGIGESK